jgi:hypothetical protein
MQAEPINLDPCWLRQEADLFKRLHQIVSGSGDGPFAKEHGYKWQLDASNNWWAELQGNKLVIAHRYSAEKAEAVARLCSLLFGPLN